LSNYGNSERDHLLMLAERIGYFQDDLELIEQALTHRSFANEKSCLSNERLEFLGDAVLSLVISTHLFHLLKQYPEGELSRLRATLVNEEFLFGIAEQLHFGDYLRLGSGERKTQGWKRPSILADAVEAVIGAIYLRYGLEAARSWIISLWDLSIKKFIKEGRPVDAKTALQERLQKIGKKPEYRLVKTEGPDHNRLFYIEVWVDNHSQGAGVGRSKKEAEQLAAKTALKHY
jgi:ribonuclease-3